MKKFFIPLALGLAGLVVVVVGIRKRNAAPPGATAADIEFSIEPSFLEPGPRAKNLPDDPVDVGPVAPGPDGVVEVQLWQSTALVHYKRDPKGNLTSIGVVPLSHDASSDGWNIWRHRHAYIYTRDQGYFWSTLGDDRLPMRDDQGKRYDAFLKAVWSYWTVVGLEARRLKDAHPHPSAPRIGFRRKVRVALRDGMLVRPASVEFQINPWHLPVRVQMDVLTSTSTNVLEMVDGFHWKFDMDDWRRRHGYQRTLFFGYQWLDGFPAPFPMNDAMGRDLDHLLEKTMAYWSEAVASEVITELDMKVAASARQ